MSNLHAAIGLAQTEKAGYYRDLRIKNNQYYKKYLSDCDGACCFKKMKKAVKTATGCEARKYLQQEEDLICCKASEFKFNKKFDAFISLFHVMSYQTENDELEKVFQNVSEHLTDGGLFIFDFWYGPAVLTNPPIVKIKRLEDDEVKITRITEPVMRYNENIVDVNFEVMIEDKKTHLVEKINETHKMRYLFLPEIELFANKVGLKIEISYKWMTYENLLSDSWYGLIISHYYNTQKIKILLLLGIFYFIIKIKTGFIIC